jgi:hypothetical protein
MRGSLHAHILCWFERRQQPPGYHALPPVERRLPGTDNRQRPQSQEVNELTNYKEDNLYHVARVGRIQTEMARPYVHGIVDRRRYGGWDYERLRIAGLARTTALGKITHRQTPRITVLWRPLQQPGGAGSYRTNDQPRLRRCINCSTGYRPRWRCTAVARNTAFKIDRFVGSSSRRAAA